MLDRRAHQFVIGRMKFHQIDAVTKPVMAAEHRFVLVGQEPRFHQRPTGQCAVGVDPRFGPAGTEPPRPFLQWQVDAVQVGAIE
ncbi:hypothetical protein D3C76_1549680 [compost metagenome]